MSRYYDPGKARNNAFEGMQFEDKFLADIGHKTATSGYFQCFFRFKVTKALI